MMSKIKYIFYNYQLCTYFLFCFLMFAFFIFFIFISSCGSFSLNSSKMLLLSSRAALLSTDSVIASKISKSSDESVLIAEKMLNDYHECMKKSDNTICGSSPDVFEIYNQNMDVYEKLALSIEKMDNLLNVWESQNNIWEKSGKRPNDWMSSVCVPVGETSVSIMAMAAQVGVDIGENWDDTLSNITSICQVIPDN